MQVPEPAGATPGMQAQSPGDLAPDGAFTTVPKSQQQSASPFMVALLVIAVAPASLGQADPHACLQSHTPMEGVPERFTGFKRRRPSFLAQRRASLLKAATPGPALAAAAAAATPQEGAPETFGPGWPPLSGRSVPIRRLPGPSPAPILVRLCSSLSKAVYRERCILSSFGRLLMLKHE